MWRTGSPSELCCQLCPSGGLWRSTPWAQPDLRFLSGGHYERRWLWLWSCIWCRWGETWAAPGCLCLALDCVRVGVTLWQAAFMCWALKICLDCHLALTDNRQDAYDTMTPNDTFSWETRIPVILSITTYECFKIMWNCFLSLHPKSQSFR